MIDLSLVNKSKTTAIIIRHADRDKMEHGQIFQPLNDEGRKHAFELGLKLQGFADYIFFSSPVDRCQQTVEEMQKGIFQNVIKEKITLSDILGEPGPFVINGKENSFKTLSVRSVVENQIAHNNLEGIRKTDEGCKIFMDFILNKMNGLRHGTLLVFVTHDAIIAPVIFEFTGEKFNHEHWPKFSDGFILESEDNEIRLIRNSQYFKLRNL